MNNNMEYNVISADGHLDLIWLEPTLFTSNATPKMRDRMPFVEEREDGLRWVSRGGAEFGLVNGMGSAGRQYVPGQIHRSDQMAAEGLYSDGAKGIRRLTDPDLRVRDQDRDGIQAEVLYGILGASQRLGDAEAADEMLRIYNDWLAGFCKTHPARLAGIACITNAAVAPAVAEIQRVAAQGDVRGVEISLSYDMKPLWDPFWHPVFEAAAETGLPLHFHTVGTPKPDLSAYPELQQRQGFASFISGFQIAMSRVVMELIYGGVFEKFPNLVVVFGESGIGWIPYILEHMDHEWEDQFKDLTLTMRPSEYWKRNCRATYQSDRVGIRNIDLIGVENVMWGNDFPHPDGVWPDSQEFIERELTGVDTAIRQRIVCDNALALYGFDQYQTNKVTAAS